MKKIYTEPSICAIKMEMPVGSSIMAGSMAVNTDGPIIENEIDIQSNRQNATWDSWLD